MCATTNARYVGEPPQRHATQSSVAEFDPKHANGDQRLVHYFKKRFQVLEKSDVILRAGGPLSLVDGLFLHGKHEPKANGPGVLLQAPRVQDIVIHHTDGPTQDHRRSRRRSRDGNPDESRLHPIHTQRTGA